MTSIASNLIHMLDASTHTLRSVHHMGKQVGWKVGPLPPLFMARSGKNTTTKTYLPNKVGHLSSQIANVQLLRSIALSRSLAVALANRDVSSATLIRGQMLEARKIAESSIVASFQNMRRKSTEHGDFAGIYRGGF